ncbi:MAG: sialate O-acetylesterase [Sphingobacteriaceae bacterium]|nr:sialate O-acetylesterase [Sphingobacteriaceae bacterium]
MNTIKTFFVSLFLFAALCANAHVKLASIFSDHMVLQRDKPVPVWGWANPGEKVTVTFNKQTKTATAGADGKWMLRLDKLSAGGPYSMAVKASNTLTVKDVYVGEVWICSGQSNMDQTVAIEDRYWAGVVNEVQEVASANHPLIRVIDADFTPSIPILNDIKTVGWEIVSPKTVGHMSAAAYFFARDIQKKLNVPVGLVVTAFGASTAEAWISKPALEANPKFSKLLSSFDDKMKAYTVAKTDTALVNKAERDLAKWRIDTAKARVEGKSAPRRPRGIPDPEKDQHNPYVLWNGMVSPLVPYAIRGALWYQGESNGPSADIYKEIMETLIADWRKQWGQGNFPFLYVQLANHEALITEPVKDNSMVTVRHAQLQNLTIPNTAMVVAIDNADPDKPGNIHPKNKQEIGRRLALAGLAVAYGNKGTYSGPIYSKMTTEGNKIRIHFKHTEGGLVAKDGQLKGFAIAGPDKKFVWADAKIDGNTVVVSSPDISQPVAVRYGWAKNPIISLYSKAENLPASPFKTDN